MPTSKTVRASKYNTYLRYVLEHLETLFSFCGSKFTPFSMYAYQGKQKTNEEIANMLLDGTFGDGMHGKDGVVIKGYPRGITGLLYQKLLQRQKCYPVAVVDMNEFRTSKVCNNCKVDDMSELDVNAVKNMLDIAASIWNGCGRPEPFVRNHRSGNGVDSLQEEAT
ncbi:MAG: hypothetical protein EXX96DRAFT_616383 [Benjaminiella poitrasii]|nr:MAG: hypothetical protein EXX96DRAFT_616383 [Benjaminiella poitrasii]